MKLISLLVFLTISIHLESQKTIGLYQVEVPTDKPYVRNITKPTLTIYLTDAEIILKE